MKNQCTANYLQYNFYSCNTIITNNSSNLSTLFWFSNWWLHLI